jgi:hypothetical protein
MAGWGLTTEDYLVFGSTVKLEAVGLRTITEANSAGQGFDYAQTLDGTVSANWVLLSGAQGLFDGTLRITSAATSSLALKGFPLRYGDSLISWSGLNGFNLAGLDTYNSVSNLYWYRLAATTTVTGMTSPTGINEVFVVPARPGLPNSGLLTTTNNFTSKHRSQMMTEIIEFKREGGKIVWYPKYVVLTGGNISSIAQMAAPYTIKNNGPSLYFFGRYRVAVIGESATRDPSQARFPDLAIGSTSVMMPMLSVQELRLGDPKRLTKLKKVMVKGEFIQPTDQLQLFVQTDNWKVWAANVKEGSPAVWDIEYAPLGAHQVTHLWVLMQLDSAVTRPTAPYLTLGLVEHDDEGEPYTSLMQDGGFPSIEEV